MIADFSSVLTIGPFIESMTFSLGALSGVAMKVWGYSKVATKDDDFTKSESYFWLIAPSGFFIAVATVYRKNNIHTHWFFGIKKVIPLLTYASAFFFGITFGILTILILSEFKNHLFAIKENFPKSLIRAKEGLGKVFLPVLKKVAPRCIPEVMPSFWDRFTAESQIKTLEMFLSEMDNARDRESLEFWKTRSAEMVKGDFTFRLSLETNELAALNLQTFQDKDYLGVEFWKTKDGTFRIRTTDGSKDNPKKFLDVSSEQRIEMEPLVKAWYRKLK